MRAVSQTTRSPWSASGVFTTAPEIEAEASTETSPAINPEVPLPPLTAAPGTAAALQILPAPPTPPPQVSSTIPVIDHYYSLPAWIIYLIGALVATIILALVVVLVMVQKIRR